VKGPFVAALLLVPFANPAGAQSRDVAQLVARVRAARYQQDSALASYQAIARQRMSASMGLVRGIAVDIPGPERLMARFESVARIRWHHEFGAWGEIIAARSAAPVVGEGVGPEVGGQPLLLPYYPGRDRLWPIDEVRAALSKPVDWIEHPLAPGADSIYAFSRGDSLTMRLPNGALINVIELRVRARRPDSRLIVGSLWVDAGSGALVRAAYRPSVPMDLWPLIQTEEESDSNIIKSFGPYTGIIREVIVENGLYEGRFWLPRARVVHAEGTAKLGHVSLDIEQTFQYERVVAQPTGVVTTYQPPKMEVDPRTGRVRRPQWGGVQQRTDHCRAHGDSSARWSPDSIARSTGLTIMYAEGVRFRVLYPCDSRDLVNSPLLPKSIYDPGDELFTETDFTALQKDVDKALSMDRQAEFAPQPTRVKFTLDRGMVRYNRVEGLSLGVIGDRVLGNGYAMSATARIGMADLQPNADVTIERGNGRTTLGATAYRRLAAANDWGDPMGAGPSLVALLFGRDEGLFYRTLGAEIKGTGKTLSERVSWSWRLYSERHDSARVETQESLARALNDVHFRPNIQALAGMYSGGAAALAIARGEDPRGARFSTIARGEAAGGETSYGRGLVEMSLSHGLGESAQMLIAGSAGSSLGDVPVQRLFYIGGAQSVHGHAAGDMAGDAFWTGHVELSKGGPFVRPTIFADIGWAGPRGDWVTSPTTIRGAGFGFALFDGFVKLDLSRGLESRSRWRGDLYVDIR